MSSTPSKIALTCEFISFSPLSFSECLYKEEAATAASPKLLDSHGAPDPPRAVVISST
jgi:hypothetical protein